MNQRETEKREMQEFGTTKRESYDSSKFYASNLYTHIPAERDVEYVDKSAEIPTSVLNTVINKDSRNMKELPDSSVHLMITSPPYNVSKEYDEDLTLKEYLSLLKDVLQETWRVLVPGGRVAVNIANVGRKPYLPLHAYIVGIMTELGYLMRGEIIWDKGASAGVSCAWGSFKQATNPCLRDVHEYILVFSKQKFKLEKHGHPSTIKNEEFTQFTKSIWNFPAVSAKRIGHPAPFPEELPRRLIELYSFQNDVILDPFMGSGTTGLAALKCNRNFVGYELSPEYANLAKERVKKYANQARLTDFV